MGNRNRTAGNGYELEFIKKIKHIWENAVSSRFESRSLDAAKVDVVNTPPFQFQCKKQMNTPSVKILDEMPEGNNVIIWGKTEKANVNFMLKEEYVIMKLETFIDLL